MKVILTQEVKGLGQHNDIVNVADGYARNYLFPRKLAAPATKAALAELEKRRKREELRDEKALEEAKELAGRLAEVEVALKGKVGAGTKLYGSITSADIAEALEQQTEIEIDKRKIEMEEPIKSLGSYEVPIRLHREAVVQLKVEVIGEGEPETTEPEAAETAAQEIAETVEPEAAEAPEQEAADAAEQEVAETVEPEAEAPEQEAADTAEDEVAEKTEEEDAEASDQEDKAT